MRVRFENLVSAVRRPVVHSVNIKIRVALGKHAPERSGKAGLRVIARYDYVYFFFLLLQMGVGLHCRRELLGFLGLSDIDF